VAVAIVHDILLQVPGVHELADELSSMSKLEREVDLGTGHHRCCPCHGCTTVAKGAAGRGHGPVAVTSYAHSITNFDLGPCSAASWISTV
jgi:hypothetical protein